MYKYTDAEKKEMVSKIVVIVDTKEQKNNHIIEHFEKKEIKYVEKNLEFGDYAFYVEKCETIGIMRDTYFQNEIIIERKASLEELSNNLTEGRQRFKNEFLRAEDAKKIMIVEKGSLMELATGKYNTKFDKKAFLASVLSLNIQFDVELVFILETITGHYIHEVFKRFVLHHYK